MLDVEKYYSTYYGHTYEDLVLLLKSFKNNKIFLAGDSTLDNKSWLEGPNVTSVNEYRELLESMRPDISYHINKLCQNQNLPFTSINCAVEEAGITDKNNLNVQDRFIRDNITSEDILVVSLGGNDLVLKKIMTIIGELFGILFVKSTEDILANFKDYIPNIIELFTIKLQAYITELTSINKPKQVIVCGMYYPCKVVSESWANNMLNILRYDTEYNKIHTIIDIIYKECICKLNNVTPLSLSDVLDYTSSDDYVARVEPSETGGKKIAQAIINSIL